MEDIFEELAAVGSDDEGRAEENDQGGSGHRDDEAVEGTDKRLVKPKRVISRPQPKLDPARLLGPRGIFTIKSTFDKIKFKGKGHELDDLNNVLSRLQHWAHRLFPKMTFEDCIERIENLGNKREILTNMHKIRNGMIDLDNGQPSQDNDDADNNRVATPPPNDNAFDQLIAAAPAAPQNTLTDEQRTRMMRNRLLAEERRMARRLAREKELEEQRQAAIRVADESGNTIADTPAGTTLEESGTNTSQDTPVPCASKINASQSAEADLPLDVFGDTVNEPTTTKSRTNKDSTSFEFVHTATMDQSPVDRMDTTDATANGEEETRVLCSAPSSSNDGTSDNVSNDQKRTQDSKTTLTDPASEQSASDSIETTTAAVGEEGTSNNSSQSNSGASVRLSNQKSRQQGSKSTLIDSASDEAAPAAKEEARFLCNSSSKFKSGCQFNSDAPVSPEPRLDVSESDLMDVEPLSDSKEVVSLCTAEDRTVQSSSAMDKMTTCQTEAPKSVSVADDLMDVGSAEDWEAAFAEEERALASQQNQS